jgi:hypothetical protein
MATVVPEKRTDQNIPEHRGDHDGKSKTASAVDQPHYPDVELETAPEICYPTYEEIAALAHRLWELRGYPENSAEQDWYAAEHELLEIARDRSSVAHIHGDGGSVQK